MVKKGKHLLRESTPLFDTLLYTPTQLRVLLQKVLYEAQHTPYLPPTSEVPNEPQTDSSPAQTSEVPIEQQPDLSPRPSPTPIIPDSIPETSGGNLGGHSSSDKSLSGNARGVPFAKGESLVQRDPLFDEITEDTVDHMKQSNDQDEGGNMRNGTEEKLKVLKEQIESTVGHTEIAEKCLNSFESVEVMARKSTSRVRKVKRKEAEDEEKLPMKLS
ncbi:hypothetical protein Tco_0955430 [Tanacetum coccineum]|uniref:Uncharacterized protein n=1 Tax=Tanacetum coccineum TaxID=301880 RepID=A0ABQ5E779_9ASTR